MPDAAPEAPEREDRRGAPPGHFGNVAFVPTEAQRQKVRTLAKTMKHEQLAARSWIASQMGFSVATLDRHFMEDMVAGRAEVVASLGATLIGVAMGTIKEISRERLDAIKYALARIGGWSSKVEMSGPAGGPVQTVDLTGLSAAALREYGRQAALQMGLDPDEAVGPPLDE
jgi:hypothetical protein